MMVTKVTESLLNDCVWFSKLLYNVGLDYFFRIQVRDLQG